jgi:hypothetical protein
VARRQRYDLLTPTIEECIISNKQSVGTLFNKGRKRRFEVTFAACINDTQLLSYGSSGRLYVSPLEVSIGIGRIQKNSDNGGLGNQFAQ